MGETRETQLENLRNVKESYFKQLEGKIFTSVKCEKDEREDTGYYDMFNDRIIFKNDEEEYALIHMQDCCEGVYIEDVCGDLKDLENSPIIKASCKYYSPEDPDDSDSSTWSFFTFATVKGYVDIRFYGSSNGYYSEGAGLYKKNTDEYGYQHYNMEFDKNE